VIEKSAFLACSPARAFALFTERASEWWPVALRHTQDPRSEILLDAGGRFWERGAGGHEVELGRVLDWESGSRLVLDFFPGTDDEHPTRVTLTFRRDGEGTRLTVEHRPTDASVALWEERSPGFERAWSRVLPAFQGACHADR
jgi:hypothetical protein